jgi:hypothetical protein
VEAIFRYPLKSMGGERLDFAMLDSATAFTLKGAGHSAELVKAMEVATFPPELAFERCNCSRAS